MSKIKVGLTGTAQWCLENEGPKKREDPILGQKLIKLDDNTLSQHLEYINHRLM